MPYLCTTEVENYMGFAMGVCVDRKTDREAEIHGQLQKGDRIVPGLAFHQEPHPAVQDASCHARPLTIGFGTLSSQKRSRYSALLQMCCMCTDGARTVVQAAVEAGAGQVPDPPNSSEQGPWTLT